MSDDLDMLAAEYVLGTLPGDERARVAERLPRDPDLRRAVERWERSLSPLMDTAAEEAPSPALWRAIERAAIAAPDPAPRALAAGDNVVVLKRRLAIWRGATFAATALAAGLAAVAFLDIVSVPAPPDAGGRYVAVVDSDGREPALIAEVDTARGTITVRSLAAEAPAGRSLELWHVAEGAAPKSLGLIRPGDEAQTISAAFGGAPPDGMFAVSVEPEGGSPTGAPTGPVVYSGRLIPVE